MKTTEQELEIKELEHFKLFDDKVSDNKRRPALEKLKENDPLLAAKVEASIKFFSNLYE